MTRIKLSQKINNFIQTAIFAIGILYTTILYIRNKNGGQIEDNVQQFIGWN